jgi:hypothetical protein
MEPETVDNWSNCCLLLRGDRMRAVSSARCRHIARCCNK